MSQHDGDDPFEQEDNDPLGLSPVEEWPWVGGAGEFVYPDTETLRAQLRCAWHNAVEFLRDVFKAFALASDSDWASGTSWKAVVEMIRRGSGNLEAYFQASRSCRGCCRDFVALAGGDLPLPFGGAVNAEGVADWFLHEYGDVEHFPGDPVYTAWDLYSNGAHNAVGREWRANMESFLRRVAQARLLNGEVAALPDGEPELLRPPEFENVRGSSRALQVAIDQAARWACQAKIIGLGPPDDRRCIFLLGETGVGKEEFAKAIFAMLRPELEISELIPQNCGAISEHLAESTLLGHEKGAFTGAISSSLGVLRRAKGGCLFLDEVHRLPKQGQGALLRFFPTGEVVSVGGISKDTCREFIVAASNAAVDASGVPSGIEPDLYHRLSGTVVRIPPLRERSGDLAELIEVFERTLNVRPGRRSTRAPPSACPSRAATTVGGQPLTTRCEAYT